MSIMSFAESYRKHSSNNKNESMNTGVDTTLFSEACIATDVGYINAVQSTLFMEASNIIELLYSEADFASAFKDVFKKVWEFIKKILGFFKNIFAKIKAFFTKKKSVNASETGEAKGDSKEKVAEKLSKESSLKKYYEKAKNWFKPKEKKEDGKGDKKTSVKESFDGNAPIQFLEANLEGGITKDVVMVLKSIQKNINDRVERINLEPLTKASEEVDKLIKTMGMRTAMVEGMENLNYKQKENYIMHLKGSSTILSVITVIIGELVAESNNIKFIHNRIFASCVCAISYALDPVGCTNVIKAFGASDFTVTEKYYKSLYDAVARFMNSNYFEKLAGGVSDGSLFEFAGHVIGSLNKMDFLQDLSNYITKYSTMSIIFNMYGYDSKKSEYSILNGVNTVLEVVTDMIEKIDDASGMNFKTYTERLSGLMESDRRGDKILNKSFFKPMIYDKIKSNHPTVRATRDILINASEVNWNEESAVFNNMIWELTGLKDI